MGRRTAVEGIQTRVRQRRQAAGLSQAALAEQAGLTRQAISAIEAGDYVPNTAVALQLARALACRVEDLFALAGHPGRPEAELIGDLPDERHDRPARVRLARVGERLLAWPLASAGAIEPADALMTAAGGRRGPVDLLVDPALPERTLVVAGCDPSLPLLGAHLARRHAGLRLHWVEAGSSKALQTLRRGEAHVAGTHLVDPDTGEANLPAVRRELAGRGVLLITLWEWQQGLIVARGNPKGIAGAAELARPDVAIVNREAGSGSRALLDGALAVAGISPDSVRGYRREVLSHLAVAWSVAVGMADAGPGILAAARAYGLDFIPLQEERYDLVIPREHLNSAPVQALLDVAVSSACRAEVEALGGYDGSRAGTIVAEVPA